MGGRIKQFRGPSKMPSLVRVLSARTVKLPPRPRERIPLTLWDVSMLSANYIQKGLLFAPPASPPLLSTTHIVDHLAAALANTLATYYPVVGCFVTDQHCDHRGNIIGCSVSIDCHGQGVKIVHADLSELIERLVSPPLRERMLHFSAESLAALQERTRQELLTAGDTVGVAALTRFQALSSLMWRCITRARRLAPEGETVCRAAINNCGRLRPALPVEYFGNTIYAIGTEAVCVSELLTRGHGWAVLAIILTRLIVEFY